MCLKMFFAPLPGGPTGRSYRAALPGGPTGRPYRAALPGAPRAPQGRAPPRPPRARDPWAPQARLIVSEMLKAAPDPFWEIYQILVSDF